MVVSRTRPPEHRARDAIDPGNAGRKARGRSAIAEVATPWQTGQFGSKVSEIGAARVALVFRARAFRPILPQVQSRWCAQQCSHGFSHSLAQTKTS